MKQKTPDAPDFQGDLMIIPVAEIPKSAVLSTPEAHNKHVLAHSESGHNHCMVAEHVQVYRDPMDELKLWLDVVMDTPLVHEKTGPDAHESINIPPGKYMIGRQREWVPDGYRVAQD